MSLPSTTVDDLVKMGVRKEDVAQQLRARGTNIDGDVVDLCVDVTITVPAFPIPIVTKLEGNARNYLVHDWVVDRVEAPRLKSSTDYSETFDNFSGSEPISQTYHRSHVVTTSVDYTLTKGWDVSVNANIPLGSSGAALGFSATKSESEVKHESKSETETKDQTYQFSIPAKEGVMVKETVNIYEVATVYKARIGVQGNIGVIADPGFFTPNHAYMGDAAQLAPGAGTDSFVTRTDSKTEITLQKIRRAGPAGSSDVAASLTTATPEVLELRTMSLGPETPAAVRRFQSGFITAVLDTGAAWLPSPPEKEADSSTATDNNNTNNTVQPMLFAPNTNLGIHIHFSGGEIPAANRRTILMTFVSRIVIAATQLGPQAISRPALQFTDGADDATISFRFDAQLTNRGNMQLLVATASNTIVWGGAHTVTFF